MRIKKLNFFIRIYANELIVNMLIISFFFFFNDIPSNISHLTIQQDIDRRDF